MCKLTPLQNKKEAGWFLRFASVSTIALYVLTFLPRAAAQREVERAAFNSCQRVALAPMSRRTDSVVWLQGAEKFFILDTWSNKSLVFDLNGLAFGSLPDHLERLMASLSVLRVRSSKGSYLFQFQDNFFMQFDLDYRLVRSVRLTSDSSRSDGREFVDNVYQWELSASGEEILAYADVSAGKTRSGEPDLYPAIVRIPLGKPSEFEVVLTLKDTDRRTRSLYRVLHYFSYLGDVPLYLRFDEVLDESWVQLLENGQWKSFSLKTRLGPAPVLRTDVRSREDFALLSEEMAASTMVVGVYGSQGRVFLLHRRGVEWFVSALDPSSGRLGTPMRVPSASPHLWASPHPDRWAFLELGTMDVSGVQPAMSVLLIKGERFAGSTGGGLCTE
jgi:hypothetical protein